MLPRTGLGLLLLAATVTTIGCDRVTKHVATTTLAGTPGHSLLGDTVRLAYVENTGGFLSLGASWPPMVRTGVFTVATGLVLLGLSSMIFQLRSRQSSVIGLTLFLAGGVSNWVDRVVHGSVVDFMNVGVGGLRTGVFNVADVAILTGVAIYIWSEFGRTPKVQGP